MRTASLWALIALIPVLLLSLVAPAQATTAGSQDHTMAFLAIGSMGLAADMVIYQAEFYTGMVEKVSQFLQLFNAGTRGAIRLIPQGLTGHYGKQAFFKDVANLITRRDITSGAGATILPLTQDEFISVKLNRKIGPVSQSFDAMKKAGMSMEDASRVFGALAGERKLKDMLTAALNAVETAIQSVAGLNNDVTALTTKTATTDYLQDTLFKMGDQQSSIVCWVLHSKPHNNLVKQLMADKVTGLTDLVTITGAIPALLGKPGIVTDATPLVDTGSPNTYNTLGLVEGAVTVRESEPTTFVTMPVAGNENLGQIFQAEYAYNVEVKGFKWNVAGGANPTDATLRTTSNWVKAATDDKALAGVRLVTQ